MKIANRKYPMQFSRGFTLVELMIVVVIVAILASLAIPSYRSQILKTHRKEAMAALDGLAQAMERYHLQNGTYVGADTSGVPNIFHTTAPIDGGAARYNLRVTRSDASTYTLQAQPIAGSGQASDGTIQLDSTGARAWDKNNNNSLTDASENNWNDR